MGFQLSALTDEELLRFVDLSNPEVAELAARLERILFGVHTVRLPEPRQLALPLAVAADAPAPAPAAGERAHGTVRRNRPPPARSPLARGAPQGAGTGPDW